MTLRHKMRAQYSVTIQSLFYRGIDRVNKDMNKHEEYILKKLNVKSSNPTLTRHIILKGVRVVSYKPKVQRVERRTCL